MVRGPVREVVRGPGPLDWSTDRGSVFSGHPGTVKNIQLSNSRTIFQDLSWQGQKLN